VLVSIIIFSLFSINFAIAVLTLLCGRVTLPKSNIQSLVIAKCLLFVCFSYWFPFISLIIPSVSVAVVGFVGPIDPREL